MAATNPLLVLIFAIAVEVALACNGYKARIVKIENCAGPDAVITLDDNFSVKLNKKCEIVPTGCVANKAFSTANSKYKLQKDGIVLKEGKFDLCAAAEHVSNEAKDMLKLFGAPASCPVAEEKICANDHRVDLSKYKAMLSMAKGNIILDSDITHDTGKSCFHVELEISKS
ncbi:uncharacterized protein LOC101463045 [Ceratitis capitata]|uniref:(Mediterranean fruit fly) hypothetical protein n=1 Tax=Ceratitis capitata TaxID=7213 RepID=W8CA58_CERCA|nr:uncharacterized protein LOC101463045 [Ceratitis capitata]CAD6999742.1 unnamed protein product [Ceratitis capitata]